MSTSYVGADLRRLVATRAERLCEYCLIHEDDTFYGCEVDHIVSERHGGPTREDNLTYGAIAVSERHIPLRSSLAEAGYGGTSSAACGIRPAVCITTTESCNTTTEV